MIYSNEPGVSGGRLRSSFALYQALIYSKNVSLTFLELEKLQP